MYVNYDNPNFNSHRQYAYLRSDGDETLLIVVNFDNKEYSTDIHIPQHAFDFLSIAQGLYNTIDLLSGEKREIMLTSEKPITLKMQGNGALIIRFNQSQLALKTKQVLTLQSKINSNISTLQYEHKLSPF